MVFNSVPQSDSSHQRQSQRQSPIRNISSMASPTFSSKSQPLHNFSLTDLKWSMNHANTPHRFRSHKSPQRAADADHSPIKNAESEPPSKDKDEEAYHHHLRRDLYCPSPPKISYPSFPSSDGWKIAVSEEIEFSEKDQREEEKGGGGVGIGGGGDDGVRAFAVEKATATATASINRSKILLRFKSKTKVDDDSDQQSDPQLPPINAQVEELVQPPAVQFSPAAETEELAPRVWNLRPRKPPASKKPHNSNGLAPSSNKKESSPAATAGQKRNGNEAKVEENDNEEAKKKKMMNKFSIPLTKGDIEEDFIALTGSKPPRRPKKRSRSVQKQLDFVFPGLWLNSITPDSYKVTANDKKVQLN